MRDTTHLLNVLRTKYELSTDWIGSLYCGLTLKENYPKATMQLFMPWYIATVLQKYNPPPPPPTHLTTLHIFAPKLHMVQHTSGLYPSPLHQLYQNSKRNKYKKSSILSYSTQEPLVQQFYLHSMI